MKEFIHEYLNIENDDNYSGKTTDSLGKKDYKMSSIDSSTLTYLLTANIFESRPMPTPWKFSDGSPLLPSCKLG